MNIVDQEFAAAEREASPSRFSRRPSDMIERVPTASVSSGASTVSRPSVIRREIGTSQTPTDGRGPLHYERNLTALSRIHTQRSQHSGTVGQGEKPRDVYRPLPEFGGGKPYPPPLPAREEYVVEFDGEHDPRHAMNWAMKKKYGRLPSG